MMECRIYDINLNQVALLQSWISFDWIEEYNDAGAFTLEVHALTGVYDLIKLDYYVGITDSDTLMIIKSIIARDNRIIISGHTAIYLLNDRISSIDIDGTSANAETLMRSIVSNINSYPSVTNASSAAGITTSGNYALEVGSAYDRIVSIAADADIGIKLVYNKDAKMLYFTCYQPTTTQRFFSEYGNIYDTEYLIGNAEYRNVAYVQGATSAVIIGETSKTGAARKELYIDATREVQGEDTIEEYKNRLRGIGYAELAKRVIGEEINFKVGEIPASLGEIAVCKIAEYGITATTRIIAVEIVSQNNRIERHYTLGTPIIRR